MTVQITNDGLKIILERLISETPTRSSINAFCAGKSQTTPNATDTELDSMVEFDSSEGDYKSFETGYPSLDTSKLELTFRGIVSDTQCNGETLNASGIVNNDSTKLLGCLGTFTGISKTTSKRIIIIFKIKARTNIEV
jgi:hypothetical protein